MSRKKKKPFLAGIGFLLFVLLSVSLLINWNGNHRWNVLRDVFILPQKFVVHLLEEGEESDQTESYFIQKNLNIALTQEVQELKELLELNRTLTEYKPVNATVLSRNRSYWFNTITIDKGLRDGIKENMVVVTSNGLIGKISKSYQNSAEVKLITADDINFKVSVAISTNGVDHYAVMNGYDNKTKCIKATGIDKTVEINPGDVVTTSGLGELFPIGIYVGEVVDVKNDKYNISKVIYIQTKQNFEGIHYVTVLKVIE